MAEIPDSRLEALKAAVDGLPQDDPRVKNLREAFAGLTVSASSEVVSPMDPDLVRPYLQKSTQEERLAALGDFLSSYIDSHTMTEIETLVTTYDSRDFYGVYKEYCAAGGDPENLLMPLEFHTEFFIAFYIQISRNPTKLSELIARAQSRKESKQLNPNQQIDLTSAAIPEPVEVSQKFIDFIKAYFADSNVSDLKGSKREKFARLHSQLTKLGEAIYGDKYSVYCTGGTTKSFRLAKEAVPHIGLIVGDSEYPPMVTSVPTENRRTVPYHTPTALMQGIYALLNEQTTPTTDLTIVLASSTPRTGDPSKVLNPKKFVEGVQVARRPVHVWIDAAQDGRLIFDGDVIFMGKKLGASGNGLILINNKTYKAGHLIHQSFKMDSGFNVESLACSVAALYQLWQRQVYPLRTLIDSPDIYIEGFIRNPDLEVHAKSAVRNLGTSSLEKEFAAGSRLASTDITLADNFSINHSTGSLGGSIENYSFHTPGDERGVPRSFRHDGIIQVKPRQGSNIGQQLSKLQTLLSKEHGVEIDYVAESSVLEARRLLQNLLAKSEKKPDSSIVSGLKALRSVVSRSTEPDIEQQAEQFIINPTADVMLCVAPFYMRELQKGRSKTDALILALSYFIEQNNYFRIRLTANDKPGTYVEFLKRLSKATKQVLAA